MSGQFEHSYRVTIGAGPGQVVFNCLADDDNDAKAKALNWYPGKGISLVLKLDKPPISKARFAAYRIYVHENSRRSHFVHGLTHDEANDVSRFPLGPQKDDAGNTFVWVYGLNDGNLI